MRKRTSLWLFAGLSAATSAACSSGSTAPSELTGESTAAESTADAGRSSIVVAGRHDRDTRTPIKHVLVIVGENRSFDHVFATYKPKGGQRIDNILAKGIIHEDGKPGPNFSSPSRRARSTGRRAPSSSARAIRRRTPSCRRSSRAAPRLRSCPRSPQRRRPRARPFRPSTFRSFSRERLASPAARPTRDWRRTR